MFDASCAYLLGGFAARLPRSHDAGRADEFPVLSNRATVAAAIEREYLRELRRMGRPAR